MRAFTRKLVVACLLISFFSACVSKPIGRPNARPLSWEFIQSVGGIRLGDPYTKDGRDWVPIIVDVSGSQAITTTPTLTNTGLICTVALADGTGNIATGMNLWVTIYAEPEPNYGAGGGTASAQCNDIPLSATIGPRLYWRYNIYYEEKRKLITNLNSRENLIGTLR